MSSVIEYKDYKFIDDDSAVPDILKNDCELSLRIIQKGCPLKCIDIPDLERVAPLIYSLEIPVNICLPPSVSSVEEAKAFVVQAFTTVCDFDAYVLEQHADARADDCKNLFAALIEIGVLNDGELQKHKIVWKVFGFSSRYQEQVVLGVDNLLYFNMSKKIDALGH